MLCFPLLGMINWFHVCLCYDVSPLLFQQVCLVTCNSDSAWNSHLIGQKHRKVNAESFHSPGLKVIPQYCTAHLYCT